MNNHLKERELWWPVSPDLMASYNDGSHTNKTADGSIGWFKNGRHHRDGDKPAAIDANGALRWFKNGVYHRDGDKPAVIWRSGRLEWFKNGLRHRISGPAILHSRNGCEWYLNNKHITREVKEWLKDNQYTYPFTLEQQVEFSLTFG